MIFGNEDTTLYSYWLYNRYICIGLWSGILFCIDEAGVAACLSSSQSKKGERKDEDEP